MAKVKIVLNRRAVVELLRSPQVEADLKRRAEQIAERAGDGMEVSAVVGKNRARASVITATPAAMRREATSRALTKSLDAGRH